MQKLFSNRNLLVFTAIVSLIIIGFLRDFIFVNINNQLKLNSGHDVEIFKVSDCMSFVRFISDDRLIRIKWILTLLFMVIYMAISCYAVWIIFRDYVRITIVAFIVLFLLSFIAMAVGYCCNAFKEDAYKFSRYLMGMAQSPVVLMVLVPAFILNERKTVQ